MKNPYGVKKAVDFLRNLIENQELPVGDRIGSICRLAKMSGVSQATMWKAVQRLKKHGILEGKAGEMTRVGGMESQVSKVEHSFKALRTGFHWSLIAQRLENDILNGVFAPGQSLGSYKILTARYGVCFATLKKALAHLADKKILKPYKKGYAVEELVPSRASSRITLIGVDSPDDILALGYIGQQFVQWIEMECCRANIGLDIISFNPRGEKVIYTDLASGRQCDLADKESVIGFVYLIVAPIAVQESVFGRLNRLKKPVAVLDISGIKLDRIANAGPRMRFFESTSTRTPAIDVARYLLKNGHKKAAYFSLYHAGYWSQLRLQGLQLAFNEAGHTDAIRSFTINRLTDSDFYEQAAQQCNIDGLVDLSNQWQKKNPSQYSTYVGEQIRQYARSLCALAESRRLFYRFFSQALKDKKITAWVCANDFAASIALDYLKEKEISVPHTISVIGFDDSALAVEKRLTSYNFNVSSVARAILDFILRRGAGPWTERKKRIEIDGVIVERQTTASLF